MKIDCRFPNINFHFLNATFGKIGCQTHFEFGLIPVTKLEDKWISICSKVSWLLIVLVVEIDIYIYI